MAESAHHELIKYLSEAHAMEKQAALLLSRGAEIVGDDEIAAIFRAHQLQTEEHARYVAERLEAHGESPSKLKDAAMQAGALGLGLTAQAAPDTPVRLATVAFSFENLEIAAYRLLADIARRANDAETLSVIERILEQEEAAAELVAGCFERVIQLTLGEAPTAPVPPVTPIGKPSERGPVNGHQGPQSYGEQPADQPIGQAPHIDTPTKQDVSSPGSGYPVDQTKPYQEHAGTRER
jgi:ferritin-like metal-binding protein YciE